MKDKKILHSNQIANISYSKFVENPISSIKEAYTKIGLDMDIETENNMEAYLKPKKLKKQKHLYNLEEFGLTSDIVQNHFKEYIETKPF